MRDMRSTMQDVPLLLSRGCYWRRCTFCVHYRSAGLTYRMHSMDFTVDMLRRFAAQVGVTDLRIA